MANTWNNADQITTAKLNQQTILQLTGAEIAALSPTYAGQFVFCTASGSGFTAGRIYVRDASNTSWLNLAEINTTQTLTNKTINASSNTITDNSIASDDLLKSNGTSFVRFAKGSNHNHLRVNGSGSIEWDEIMGNEIGRASLGSAATSLTVSSLPAKKYLFVVIYGIDNNNGGQVIALQFNSDTGANYSYRYSASGAAETTGSSQTKGILGAFGTGESLAFIKIKNVASKAKIAYAEIVGDGGDNLATTIPSRFEGAAKWANTSAQITSITLTSTVTFAAGTEIVVYGTD